jgi:hypothetical protein
MVNTTFGQELFLRELLICKNNATEAWQRVYNTPSRASAQAISSKTLAKPHVKRRLNELRGTIMQKKDITLDKVLDDIQWAIDHGKANSKPADVIAGANSQAKLVGLLRERVETGGVGDFSDNSLSDILQLVAKEAGPDAAMTLAAMFGLKVPESKTTEAMKEAILFISDPGSDAVN